MRGKGYTADQSELGNVYYPAEGIARDEKVSVNYVEYPWITCFEVEGFTIPQKEEEQKYKIGLTAQKFSCIVDEDKRE